MANVLLLFFISWTLAVLGRSSSPCDDACLIACAEGAESCASVWAAPVPPSFTTRFVLTGGGHFDVVVADSTRAPPMAARFFVLSKLAYFVGAPFYRVLRLNATDAFVAQVGYRGVPSVDAAWLSRRMSNETVAVAPPGNVRGTVAFGTGEVPGPLAPNCSAAQCSLGFSVELFINLADNTRLDAADFSPFGAIDASGMALVDQLYWRYGELADLCSGPGKDEFCVPKPPPEEGWAGINLTQFLLQGNAYARSNNPSFDYVSDVYVL